MKLLLFDVDGTICESGKQISEKMAILINKISNLGVEIGIVGGGVYEKILFQLNNKVKPKYIFSECGSVYHIYNKKYENYELINKNNIRNEAEYPKINKLVKVCLKFISEVDYILSGNFIDLRNGLIYVSLVGMVATDEERQKFIELDNINNYRFRLLDILKKKAIDLNIINVVDITLGGSVGISIYPKKWNKIQVLKWIDCQTHNEIHYFGDKYLPDGNDFELLSHESIIPHSIDSIKQTYSTLEQIYNKLKL